jgi:SAM-dependent methyltransferase
VESSLKSEIQALAPWHVDIEIAPGLRTSQGNIKPEDGSRLSIGIVDPDEIRPLLKAIYPEGLGGKRFLDVACNGGGYSMVANDLGAEYVFGFDVREHWIKQAEFLKRHLAADGARIEFALCDLREIDEKIDDARFDICLFKGIFYHLPDPIASLKEVADRTEEILILDTAVAKEKPDGYLQLVFEGTVNPMSGVHELAWFPTGVKVLKGIVDWLGFPESRLIFWKKPPRGRFGRIRIIAARSTGLLSHFDKNWKQSRRAWAGARVQKRGTHGIGDVLVKIGEALQRRARTM